MILWTLVWASGWGGGVMAGGHFDRRLGLLVLHDLHCDWLKKRPEQTVPGKHEMMGQCWYSVEPASKTLGQHCTNIGCEARTLKRLGSTPPPLPPPPSRRLSAAHPHVTPCHGLTWGPGRIVQRCSALWYTMTYQYYHYIYIILQNYPFNHLHYLGPLSISTYILCIPWHSDVENCLFLKVAVIAFYICIACRVWFCRAANSREKLNQCWANVADGGSTLSQH